MTPDLLTLSISGTLSSPMLTAAGTGKGSTFQLSSFCGLVFMGLNEAIKVS